MSSWSGEVVVFYSKVFTCCSISNSSPLPFSLPPTRPGTRAHTNTCSGSICRWHAPWLRCDEAESDWRTERVRWNTAHLWLWEFQSGVQWKIRTALAPTLPFVQTHKRLSRFCVNPPQVARFFCINSLKVARLSRKLAKGCAHFKGCAPLA